MLQLAYKTIHLPFEFPFALSKGLKTQQSSLLVSLGLGRLRGYGEATEILYYEHSKIDKMIESLEKHRRVIESYSINSPERFFHFLHHLIPGEHFLMSALDMAAWDLWAKMNGKTVGQLIGADYTTPAPATSYTLGFHTPEEIKQIISKHPFPAYKLKVGGKKDLQSLQTLRALTKAQIRIDANEGWNLTTAMEILPYLSSLNIELIEQPFPKKDLESLTEFRKLTALPILADEACQTEEDLDSCLQHYDGINIKLSKFGGLTPALQLVKKIKNAGKKVMLGGMCESYIGATATAQLLPFADYVDIDGPLLLQENFGTGITYDNGRIVFPEGKGLGVRIG